MAKDRSRDTFPTVGKRQPHTESGQAMAELALILGTIAIVCILAIAFLGDGIRDRFGDAGSGIRQAGPTAVTPPSSLPGPTNPTTTGDCDGNGWKNYPQFKNAAECRKYFDVPKPPKK